MVEASQGESPASVFSVPGLQEAVVGGPFTEKGRFYEASF